MNIKLTQKEDFYVTMSENFTILLEYDIDLLTRVVVTNDPLGNFYIKKYIIAF